MVTNSKFILYYFIKFHINFVNIINHLSQHHNEVFKVKHFSYFNLTSLNCIILNSNFNYFLIPMGNLNFIMDSLVKNS